MRTIIKLTAIALLVAMAGCEKNIFETKTIAPASLRSVPSLRLNFRYEPDVPAPASLANAAQTEEKNAVVQADFDANRNTDILAKTITSPNKQRILVVYQRLGDPDASFRLDMYSGDGKLLRRVSPETMTVDFPDIIVWSPDSTTVAFVAIARDGGLNSLTPLPVADTNSNTNSATRKPESAANVNANVNVNANANEAAPPVTPVPSPSGDAAPNVVTFRTEQIYICNSEGLDLKPITQNEGLIYYFFAWSPDSSMLACLAATYREWRYLLAQADRNNEVFVPLGRARIVEKNGRERRLDDNLTAVHPVWSPDSAKVAIGYQQQQIRIYDAIGDQPTQAAVPIKNQLLFSSQAYDLKVNTEQGLAATADANANVALAPNPAQPSTTLPDEKTLVSFQPMIELDWPLETELYFQTGYVKQYKTGDGARSSLRWHRLILSPQATSLK